jgi:hypothetical protein
MDTIGRTRDERFLSLDESVIAAAALGPPTGERGTHRVRVILTSRGRLVAFSVDRGRPLFSVNLDEIAGLTTSVKFSLVYLGAPLYRLQLTLNDGSSIQLQASGFGATRRARALGAAIREALTERPGQ